MSKKTEETVETPAVEPALHPSEVRFQAPEVGNKPIKVTKSNHGNKVETY